MVSYNIMDNHGEHVGGQRAAAGTTFTVALPILNE